MAGPIEPIDDIFKGLNDYYPGSKTKRKSIEPTLAYRRSMARSTWDSKPFPKLINGVEHEMFTLGAMSDALERPIVTVRLWTRKGHIPQAPYRLPTTTMEDGSLLKGRRLYTRALVEATVKAFEDRGLIGSARVEWNEHKDLTIELLETWTRIHERENSHLL